MVRKIHHKVLENMTGLGSTVWRLRDWSSFLEALVFLEFRRLRLEGLGAKGVYMSYSLNS